MRVLSKSDVAGLIRSIKADDIVTMMAKTMHAVSLPERETSAGTPAIQSPLRISTTTDDCTMLYMPARLTTARDVSMTAVKVVGVPKPDSSKAQGLPGTILLFDETTGACEAVINSSELTGLRTAAVSALSVRLMTRDDVKHLVVFGTGVQAYFHARLICSIRPSLKTVTFICRQHNERAQSTVQAIRHDYPSLQVALCLQASSTARAAVKTADVICTCVPTTRPVFDENDLPQQVHITAIGSYKPDMHEFPASLIAPSSGRVKRILVDSRSACLAEAGEIISSGIARVPENLVEIGSVVDAEGRANAHCEEIISECGGVTLFKSVGVGAMDVAIATLVFESAQALRLGIDLDYE